MAFGIIEYNEKGQPMCEICGKYYDRVVRHVRLKHNLSEREYKSQFGFEMRKGICSKESSEKTRIKTLENYATVIAINLTEKGKKSRFNRGCMGRKKEQISEETRLKFIERLKQPEMQDVLKNNGRKLGLSGLGNKKRWGK